MGEHLRFEAAGPLRAKVMGSASLLPNICQPGLSTGQSTRPDSEKPRALEPRKCKPAGRGRAQGLPQPWLLIDTGMQLGEGEAGIQPLAVIGMQGPPCADRETETPHSRSWMAFSDVLGPFLA